MVVALLVVEQVVWIYKDDVTLPASTRNVVVGAGAAELLSNGSATPQGFKWQSLHI